MRALKVWGCTSTPPKSWGASGRQVRLIVAATSQVHAHALLREVGVLGWSLYAFRQWWAETGNDTELAVASEAGVWWSEERGSTGVGDWHAVEACS